MKISTNSWHYKLYKLTYTAYDFDVPSNTNLCQYMRRIMLLAPITLFYYVASFMALLVVLVPLLFILGWRPQKHFFTTTEAPFVRYWNWPKWEKKHPTTNIVIGWLQAKKDGICPLVEFNKEEASQ